MISRAPNINPWRLAVVAVPFATLLLSAALMPLPFSIKVGGYWVMPSLPLIATYLWTMHRPDLLSPLAVLVTGLLYDLLTNAPLGISGLAFVTAYSVVVSQRLYWLTLSGPGAIAGFVIVMLIAEIVTWAGISFAYGRFVSPVPGLIELAISALVFPLARAAFGPLARVTGSAP
jgi:rod shape-determining protein MreD